jgi:hypothetical protein
MKQRAHERRQKARQPECSAAIQDASREYEESTTSVKLSMRPDQHTDCRRLPDLIGLHSEWRCACVSERLIWGSPANKPWKQLATCTYYNYTGNTGATGAALAEQYPIRAHPKNSARWPFFRRPSIWNSLTYVSVRPWRRSARA